MYPFTPILPTRVLVRRGILTLAIFTASTAVRATQFDEHTFDLKSANVADIQAAVAAGALTYEHLVELYLARIEAYDDRGPALKAIIEINPNARAIARALDEEQLNKGLRSPLHGIPIAVKDTIDVADIPSASGNLALAGTYPAHDATVVAKLRAAGAIIFLKTNLDEFNMGAEGLSSLGGQTLNPYDLSRNPGGSSAGSGVAVNVGFATLALGTESGASVRSPSSNNALVGIAPSQGLVSRGGVMAISYTQDRVGAMAKTVHDAALLLQYMQGFDAADLFTWQSLGRLDGVDYLAGLDAGALSGARIGVLRDMFRKGEEFGEINRLLEAEIRSLRGPSDEEVNVMPGSGAMLVDGLSLGLNLIDFFADARASVPEIRATFDTYLRARGPDTPVHSLAELVATGKYLPALEPLFQRVLELPPPDENRNYHARLDNRTTIRQLVIDLMDRHHLDALVYPFKSLAAPPLGTPDRGPRDNPVSSVTGLPAIVVPAGVDSHGLPISLEFLGRPFSEATLFALAYAYEQHSHKRVAPTSTPPLPGERFTY
jgi:Asp-tRNA(Asn)/Glu-tRNA(Gln) amidotransferase A subunit family amidase